MFIERPPSSPPSVFQEEFEDTKGVIRIRISKKNRQHNGQKKYDKRTNNDLQNIHIYLKKLTKRDFEEKMYLQRIVNCNNAMPFIGLFQDYNGEWALNSMIKEHVSSPRILVGSCCLFF